MEETPKINVLLIDDDEEDCAHILYLLSKIKSQRYHLDWIVTVDAAIETADHSTSFDIILLDYDIGTRTELELLRRIGVRWSKVPFILLTGQGDHPAYTELLEAGATVYLDKRQLTEALLEHVICYAIEGKQREEPLRILEEAQGHGFTERIPVITYALALDETGNTLYVSPRIEKILGFNQAEWLTDPQLWPKTIHPDDRERVLFERGRCKVSGEPFVSIYRMVAGDGRILWFHDKADIIRDKAGHALFLQGVIFDISVRGASHQADNQLSLRIKEQTSELRSIVRALCEERAKRRQINESLNRSEDKYRELVENACSIIIKLDTKGNFTFCNDFAQRFFGYSEEEMLGRNAVETIVPRSDSSGRDLYEMVRVILQDPDRYTNNENENMRRNGERVWIAWTNKAIFDDRGKLCGVLCVGNDITVRRRTEEALERLTLQNKLILDAAGEGIIGMDRKGRVTFVNPAATKMLGWSIEDLIGKSLHPVIHHTKADGTPNGRHECRVCTAYHTGKTRSMEDEIFWKKDGSFLPIEYVTTPIVERGEVIGAVLVFQDIGPHRQWERQLRQAHKMQSLGTLAGGIAHDFNNILATMILNTEMAMDEVNRQSPVRRNMERVLKAGNRAKDLVEQILTFSQHSEQTRQPSDITPVVKETLKMIGATIPPTIKVSLRTRSLPDGNPALILADPTQIHQVIMNLCVNAIHAMEKRRGKLRVDIFPVDLDAGTAATYPETDPGPYLVIRVSDTGGGIDQSIMDRIFDPFFTTRLPGEGTGLGLFMVYGIVKSHGGSIRVKSKPGRETVFEVLLPMIDAILEEQGNIENASPLYLPGGSERILLVDDEEEFLETCRKILGRLGYKVVAQKNPLDALEAFRARPDRFDLIITDQTMPKMSGIELAKTVLRIRSNVPIILCSGYNEISSLESVKTSGIRELLSKPFNRKQMAESIRWVLDAAVCGSCWR